MGRSLHPYSRTLRETLRLWLLEYSRYRGFDMLSFDDVVLMLVILLTFLNCTETHFFCA